MARSLAELEKYLVGKWKLDNNFKDLSGNGNHGTPTDIEWKPSERGMKPEFNVTSDITMSEDTIIGAQESFTISIWSKTGLCTEQNLVDFTSSPYSPIGIFNPRTSIRNALFQLTDGVYRYVYPYDSPTLCDNEWHLITGVFDRDLFAPPNIYVDGILVNGDGLGTCSSLTEEILISSMKFGTDVVGNIGELYLHKTALTANEALALYNATKDTHGVIPAERSYTHRLSPPVDNSTVFATDMHTKDGYDLVDLSGNGNNGAVNGAVRSGGYFTDGMRFDGVDDFIESQYSSELDITDTFTIQAIFKTSDLDAFIVDHHEIGVKKGYALRITGGYIDIVTADGTTIYNTVNNTNFVSDNKTHEVFASFNNGNINVLLDGNAIVSETVPMSAISPLKDRGVVCGIHPIGYLAFSGIINISSVSKSNGYNNFNSLAVLPIFSFDAADYPANDTVYDSNIPYSSIIVTSGSFKINLDNELECITTGALEMRNSHQFDGAEYVTLDIGGVKTSGTGTAITDTFLTSAGVVQGNNKIYVVMVTGQKLNRIDIQFRAPVE